MAGFGYSRSYVTGGSAFSSTVTLGPILIADYRQCSLSIATSNGSASNHTIQASNDDGFLSSINTWSNLSIVAAQGVLKIDVGPRWIRILRPSVDSQTVYGIQGFVG